MSSTSSTSDHSSSRGRWAVTFVVAVGLTVAYLLFGWQVWRTRGETADQWARSLVVLGGIEALTFSAVGWMFARDVSRQAIGASEDAAQSARDDADAAQREAETAKARAVALATALDGRRELLESTAVDGVVGVVLHEYAHVAAR